MTRETLLDFPVESRPTPEQLEAFREEIQNLYEDERAKRLETGHFYYAKSKDEFRVEELDEKEYQLWKIYKLCREGKISIVDGLCALDEYREWFKKQKYSQAQYGVDSYVGTELHVLSVEKELADKARIKAALHSEIINN